MSTRSRRRELTSHGVVITAVCGLACGGGRSDRPTNPAGTPTAVEACRLSSSFGGVGLGFPRGANRLRTIGDVRATVLFTDFSDAVATRTPQSAFGLISPAAENYYKAVSYGKMNLILGHTMGLPDLYAFSGSTHRFGGIFSLMGLIAGPAREFFAWERWQLGWVTDDQVTCAPAGTTTATLTPIEHAGGTKMVVVPTGTKTAVVVESRRIEGYDSGFPSGVLAYYIDTSIASGNGVLKVLPVNDSDANKSNATLDVGESLTFSGVTVTFVSRDAATDRVRVTRGP